MPPSNPQNTALPPNPPLQKGDLRKELGVSGTLTYKGFIRGEEYSRDLQGRQALQNFDVMARSDGTTHATLQVCKLPILAAHWSFESPSDDPGDLERTDLCNREFFDRNIDFYDVASEGLTCLDYGYSLAEIVYEPTTFNGQFRWGLGSLPSRKQLTVLNWETSKGLLGITQIAPFSDTPMRDIPMQKLVVWTNEKRGDNYEGISLLRFAYKHWYLKDKLELMNAVALERMGLGIPVLKTGVNGVTTPEPQVDIVEAALRQIRVNEEAYLKLPPGLEVEMLTADVSKVKDILPTLQYEDTQIMLSVLAQFLGLGMNGKGGSRALSDDHSQLFLRALEAVARIMARGFQSIANRMIDLNYSDLPNGYPKLTFDGLDDDDITTISTSLNQLVVAGVITPGLDVENRARRMLKIKELTEKDYKAKQAEEEKQTQAAEQAADIVAAEPPKPGDEAEEAVPEKTDPKADPKAKKKAEALTAARTAQQNLLTLVAAG